MAASSSSVAAHEVVQVLVASLADESPLVREASVASLKEIAPMDPLLVLSCCRAVSRGGRRRFGNMAAVFQVMAWAVKAMDRNDVDRTLMEGLAKIATSEMITSKDINADWQRSAARLLVSIGSLVPDLMMEEIFLHLSGPSSTLPSMVQILADFALTEALQFTPQLKEVLSRILPVLGNVRDNHKPIFANAFRCWCEAVLQYRMDVHSDPLIDTDVMSFLTSVFELLLKVWSASRNIKVRMSSIEALGQMVILVSRTQLKAALPRLIPATLDLCRKEYEIAFPSTCSLRNLLNAALLSESGPPLIEFEELLNTLFTLLPMACVNIKHDEHSDFSIGLKTYNEVQHCFVVIGMVYPEDILVFLLHRCQSKDEVSVVGALCVLKHLLPRLSEAWNSKMSLLIDAVKLLFDERSLVICMALSELLVVMASYCYLSGASGESSIEYLVHHCAISEEEIRDFRKETVQRSGSFRPFQYKKLEVKFGSLSPLELRAICEKGLLLLTVTIPEMEHILWPFVLKMIIPKKYTGAVATVCKCISELSRHKSFYGDSMMNELVTRNDFLNPVDIFARLIVLLHDPLSREQLSTHILTVLCQLGPLFPRNMILFWQDEVPKMKAYISDPDDLKQDCSYLETWDSMIINFLAESLDVVRDSDWVISLGKAFSRQYDLYAVNGGHSALLHRCLGMLLQKVDDRAFVREKIEWMYKNADISVPTNRLGLAKGMGLVAASHLDTVLEKLKNILDNVGRSKFRRFLSLFYGRPAEDADDIHAALALMYGYAARYAPSTVIEARIDALVGTNMLSHLLHVRHPTAKQAVITAIDLLGHAVINAADKGISFPLKRRDMMLEYVLTLMGRDDIDGSSDSHIELLHTQTVALSACTTLVSLEPKLPMETRNHVMKATLGFFALPNHPVDIVDPLIDNLITLLCAILLTSGEDGRSRSEQLLHILRQIDQFVSSSLEHQRRRGCLAVYELLYKFRVLCSGGFPSVGSNSAHGHGSQVERVQPRNFNLPSAFVLPSRESLSLGERIVTYIPRCADTNYDVRKVSIQVVGLFFSIAMSLPKLAGSKSVAEIDLEESYTALYSLEDVISILRRDASIDQSEVFNRVVSSVCSLLTKNELVTSLHACSTSLCDKIKQSAEGAIQAVTEFILKRGTELNESEVSRTTQSLLSATMLVVDKNSRQEVLNTISCLAENTYSKVVFNDVLAAAGRDIATKDVHRLRGGWPMQDAFHAFSQHHILSSTFLEHVISVLNEACITKVSMEKSDSSCHPSDSSAEEDILLAAVAALTALFRGGGKIGRKSVEQSYASVLSALILQLGSCSGIAQSGHSEPLWTLLSAFQSFCECVGDLEMGKILARHTEQNTVEKWIELIGEVARCISMKRPKEVPLICSILNKALDRSQRFQREAAAAALSDFICYSNGAVPLLEQMVEAMCLHVSDESSSVRSLCLRGLVQIPDPLMLQYISQVLGVIVALLEDPDESVQLTSVQCLMTVLKQSPKDAVDPLLLNISLRLRYLQASASERMRASAFAAYGLLCSFGFGLQHDAFLEQVHATLPRLVLHVNDEDVTVRQACRETLKKLTPLIEVDNISDIFNMQHFCSDKREDYQDFVRDLTRQLSVNFANKADTYLASAIQVFDAPWPVIQANAIYFSCNLLSLLKDQRSLAPYFSQVLGMVLGKLIRSTDAVVRATCSFAVGVLLRASNPHSWAAPPLNRVESSRRPEESVNQDSDGNPTS